MGTPRQRKMAEPRLCVMCGKTFSPRMDGVEKGMGKYCSRRCSADAKQTVKINDHVLIDMYVNRDMTLMEIQRQTGMNWKAVRRRLVANNTEIRKPRKRPSEATPYPTRNGMKEHVQIAEAMIGRKLKKGDHYTREVVHHIDMDPTNNTEENLAVMTKAEHFQVHYQMETLVAEMVKMGAVGYDKKKNLYYLKRSFICK